MNFVQGRLRHLTNILGSVLSVSPNGEKTNLEEEIDEEFQDALDEVEATIDNMNNLTTSENQENLVTDAIESKFTHIFDNTANITFETVADIEKELDYYEKVSLVFLLYDQEDNALQSLLVEQANNNQGLSTNLLYDWAKSKHTSNSSWQQRFVEALCVIQNYAILRRLGFTKEEMEVTYLPTQPCTALHLDRLMKALYCICEQLSAKDTKAILKHLEADFKKLNLDYQIYSENHLEFYLLHCLSIKFIKKNDVSNLSAILKSIGQISKAEMLDTVLNNSVPKSDEKNKTNFDLNKKTENYANPIEPSCSDVSVISDNSIYKVQNVYSEDCYKIDPTNVGICLIINEIQFYKEKVDLKKCTEPAAWEELCNMSEICEPTKEILEERKGSEIDGQSLKEMFKKLGFRIVIRENLNNKEVISTIKEMMGKFTEKDCCFVVCIMSHGVKEKIYAANSIPVAISTIRDTLHDRKYEKLLGKPKLLIIQSCQGNVIQKVYSPKPANDLKTDGPSNKEELNLVNDYTGVPERCDLLLCMSTVAGFASVRSEGQGSWYIQELCRIINEKCEVDHFQDILTKVHHEVINKRWPRNGDIVTMVPEFTTSLSKKLYLRKVE